MTTTTATRPTTAPDVPAGHYGLVKLADGKTYFFQVDRPTEGKWKGFTFVSQLSGDNHLPVRDREQKFYILRAISRDPIEALWRYADEFKTCGVCGRGLTDETSRLLGIGPVCIKKFGDGAEDHAWKLAYARREAEQERAAYAHEIDENRDGEV